MHHLSLGVKGESQVLVTGENAIGFLGPEGARVLSTPHMIGYMEFTCRNIALPLLETGYDTVGAHVDVKHLAAAPLGVTVRFLAEIIGIDDRRVRFRVEAWAENEKIGEGTHERAIVNVARFTARQAEKLKKT
ncbi:MAG: thioesterase family protein [Bryobacteraceae bacterium]|jgi:predicted thioesterase